MKRYKFQALVTLCPPPDGEAGVQFGPSPCRPGGSHIMVTLRLVGDDVADYLGIGSRFQPRSPSYLNGTFKP